METPEERQQDSKPPEQEQAAPEAAEEAPAPEAAEEAPAPEAAEEAPAAEAEAPAPSDADQAEVVPDEVEGTAAPEQPAPEEPPAPQLVDLAADARYMATGKRKSAVARVILRPGNGAFDVNGRALDVYFPRRKHQASVRQPLDASGYLERIDVRARIHGGGASGQADALRHGIAKALIDADPNLRGELKRRQLLTRDPRVKERRKAGFKKARKRPQFSKR
jgi:small subunit ribosomal protein S9